MRAIIAIVPIELFRWGLRITVDGREQTIGSFKSHEMALLVAQNMRQAYELAGMDEIILSDEG